MTDYAFITVDVFTSVRFGGNPLAVIPDARGLTTEQMAKIAREFNYSESTFVFPPADPSNTAQVRIFTPTSEVPFAGHPNVGTAFVLAEMGNVFGKAVGSEMIFEEIAGLVRVKTSREPDGLTATITAPEPLSVTPVPAHVDIARALSIEPSAIVIANHPPLTASVGLAFVVVEVDSLDTLARCKPDLAGYEAADRHLPGLPGGVAIFVYTRSASDIATTQARMFAPLDGVLEDPATGSASAALGGLLASLLPDPDLILATTIRQGVEMGRPSLITVVVTKRGGIVTKVEVTGTCVPVMQGTISVDQD